MSTSTMDLDRVLKTALTERAAGDTDGLLEEILRTAAVTPQRRSVWGLPALPRLALVAAATLVLAALLGAVAVLSGLLPDPVPVPVLPQNGPIMVLRGGLVAVNPETQRLEELALGLAPRGYQRPAVAPDGTAVAFARGKEVWVQQGGGLPRHAATCPDGVCEGFEWSSDGAFLTIGWGYRAIDIVEVATGRLSAIGTEGNEIVAVSWAPDGQRLAIIEWTGPPLNGQDLPWWVLGESLVRVYERNGSGSSLVFSGAGHRFADVAWSPDGTTLALLGLEFDADSALTTSVLTLALGDGALKTLVELPGRTPCAGICPGYPNDGMAWSPDRSQLAVVAENDLYVVHADGTDLRLIMERVDGNLVWVSAPAHD